MVDAAHPQEEETERRGRRSARSREHQHAAEPLYSIVDALLALDFLVESRLTGSFYSLHRAYASPSLMPATSLGRLAFILNWKKMGGSATCCSPVILDSGRPLLRDPALPPKADVVVMETTYGDRLHRPFQPSGGENFTKRLLTL
ncbi:MAG: putative enzyme [Candidatus Gallionella acididurans]|uniref:Putative enzyme n=1 Tax=Candidatus Gallionella acididurans TaxID=1796491 RepID=A0A139BQN5_9PROT|nr:MAG: putative enzyme [Candidatus Gallionella acididurans]